MLGLHVLWHTVCRTQSFILACTFCGTLCAAHRASFLPAHSATHAFILACTSCSTRLHLGLHVLQHTAFWLASPAAHGSTWACMSCSTQHFGLHVLRHTASLGLAPIRLRLALHHLPVQPEEGFCCLHICSPSSFASSSCCNPWHIAAPAHSGPYLHVFHISTHHS